MEFVDTHCHIHFSDYKLDPDEVIVEAINDGVTRMICVGCTLEDSQAGVEFVQKREGLWAAVGLHPHEAHHYVENPEDLNKFAALLYEPQPPQRSNSVSSSARQQVAAMRKIVAIGECGLDYYYNHSPKEAQVQILEFQLQLASENNLPVIFHVRDAFDDFWPIFDNFKGLRGVIHSYTADRIVLAEALKRELYIGLNGIMTFTKDEEQLEAAKAIPLEKLCLETDAPFLTPKPFRGKVCKPSHVATTGEFLADLRKVPKEELAYQTTRNAIELFNLK